MGADDAVNIILNAKYAGKTEVGNSKDATSLDNMLNAIRWMKSVNDYRKSVGLSELRSPTSSSRCHCGCQLQ